mgnify:CR=1 FL=1
MSDIDKIKKLRQSTGAGFKDCNAALKESDGDLNKAAEVLRIKGIAKASKKMSRDAKEGVIVITGDKNKTSIIEVNCETDFVAKNNDFLNFVKELSELNNEKNSNIEELKATKMKNGQTVNDNLVALIAKIGEKITIRRSQFFDKEKGLNFFYVHSAIQKNIGKIISVVKIEGITKGKNDELGTKIAMHIAASNPLAIEKEDINKKIVEKELEIIKAEAINSGKPKEIAEKISSGKLLKFLNENSLLNQIWIMDPKKKVSDILKENSTSKEIKILDFVKYKVGEGV